MSRKTKNAYKAVLQRITQIVNLSSWAEIMADFEVGLRNACRIMVPAARIAGCHVHYERVIIIFFLVIKIILLTISTFLFTVGTCKI